MADAAYRTFAEAYVALLREVLDEGRDVRAVVNPSSIGSSFGSRSRPFRELSAYSFAVSDPEACLVRSPVRELNLEYAIAQWIWTIGGSDDVAAIAYYNPRGWNFTEDGHSLRGAFGHRMRRAEGIDQLERVVQRLRRDPSSRREVVHVALPSDLRADMRDQPCLVAMQFLLRDELLESIVFMRSQSAALVLPYDASLLMMIQCWMAATLGVKPGRYTHFAGSLHLYDDERAMAEDIASGPAEAFSVPVMVDPQTQTEHLVAFEATLRSAVLASDLDHVRRLATTLEKHDGDFFVECRRLLVAGAAARLGCAELRSKLVSGLPGAWRTLLMDRSRPGVSSRLTQ